MSTNALDRIGHGQAAGLPARAGQATQVEQSRAIAEVQAAVVIAQQMPRDEGRARLRMQDACGLQALAERAFFRFSRGGSAVSGPTIHLARELARCWGNLQYGIVELSCDDHSGESQMQAWAWDLETNTRQSTTFIVKHSRGGRDNKLLTDPRDIYENNANNGARRLREMILATLPTWFVDEAKQRAHATLQNGGGAPLAVRIDGLLARFRELGVQEGQLVERLGRPRTQWDAQDVATLTVVGGSLTRGETTVAEEFPVESAPAVTSAEVLGRRRTGARAQQQDQPALTPEQPVQDVPAGDPPAGYDDDAWKAGS